MPYIKETCIAGNTIEVRKYYSPRYGVKGEKRKKRLKPTEESVKRANVRKAETDLRRLMNHNFDKKAWSVTLTFRRQPSLEELQKAVARFTRKLRTIAKRNQEKNTKKEQSEMKYIYVLGIGPRRRHAHMLITGLTAEEISDAWEEGHMSHQRVYSDNLRDLASYYIKNAEESRKHLIEAGLSPGRRWNGSRNLIKPEPQKEVIKANSYKTDIRCPKGYYIDKDTIYEGVSSFTGLEFFEYTLIRMEGTG